MIPLLRHRGLLALLAVFLLLRLGFWLGSFPNPDEAYYWLWSQKIQWSYYDHPPLLAWINGVVTRLFGSSPFTLRLGNGFSNGLLLGTYAHLLRYLYGDRWRNAFGLVLLTLLASPLYFLFTALAWPDQWLIAWSLLANYQFVRFLDGWLGNVGARSAQVDFPQTLASQLPASQSLAPQAIAPSPWIHLAAAAVALGLALLCKYSAVLTGLAWLGLLGCSSRFRPLWREVRLYGAMALALCFLTPILIWNSQNGWQSFAYYTQRSAGAQAWINIMPCVNFLLFSWLLLSPWIWQGFWQIIQQARPHAFARRTGERAGDPLDILPSRISTLTALAYWTFIPSTVLLTLVSLRSAALYYWNISAYLLLIALLPQVWIRPNGELRYPRRFWWGQAYGLLFASLLLIHYAIFPLSALLSPTEDPDSRMLYGWPQIAQAVRTQLAASPEPTLLLTTDYRSASALAFALGRTDIVAVSDRLDQFDFWPSELSSHEKGPTQALPPRQVLVLADDWHPMTAKFRAQFEQLSGPTPIPVTRFGRWIKNYYQFTGSGWKP